VAAQAPRQIAVLVPFSSVGNHIIPMPMLSIPVSGSLEGSRGHHMETGFPEF
jgi:hypothetical protein